MAPRNKKVSEDNKVAVAVPIASNINNNNNAITPNNGAVAASGKVIDVENFIRVRDSVYSRLATIQDLMRSFSTDYLRQTNLLLGEPTNIDDGAEIPNLDNMLNFPVMPPMPAAVPQPEEKKERKKRSHDPNAPKRPLTPYFLYMQTARPIIAQDLGDQVAKGAVQDEGQRRWSQMTPEEKMGWNQAYQYNLRLYNARVHSYKAGNAIAKEMTDEQALRYCDEYAIPMPNVVGLEAEAPGHDHVAPAQLQQQPLLQQQSVIPLPEQPEEPSGKTPKAKASRKRKNEVVEPAASTPATASPDKKRKRGSKVEQPEKVDEPKKSGRKKAKSG